MNYPVELTIILRNNETYEIVTEKEAAENIKVRYLQSNTERIFVEGQTYSHKYNQMMNMSLCLDMADVRAITIEWKKTS